MIHGFLTVIELQRRNFHSPDLFKYFFCKRNVPGIKIMDINSCELFRIFLSDSGVDSGVLLGIITEENELLIGKCLNHPNNQKKFYCMACFMTGEGSLREREGK